MDWNQAVIGLAQIDLEFISVFSPDNLRMLFHEAEDPEMGMFRDGEI